MRRSRSFLIAFVAAIVELVIIAASGNQWVTNRVAEKATGTALKPVSQESDVKSVLSKVETGDADAGLVYVTDVNSAGDKVQGVDFPEASQASTNYPIAVLKNAPAADLANQFLTTVTGEPGQKALEQAGFAKP